MSVLPHSSGRIEHRGRRAPLQGARRLRRPATSPRVVTRRRRESAGPCWCVSEPRSCWGSSPQRRYSRAPTAPHTTRSATWGPPGIQAGGSTSRDLQHNHAGHRGDDSRISGLPVSSIAAPSRHHRAGHLRAGPLSGRHLPRPHDQRRGLEPGRSPDRRHGGVHFRATRRTAVGTPHPRPVSISRPNPQRATKLDITRTQAQKMFKSGEQPVIVGLSKPQAEALKVEFEALGATVRLGSGDRTG